MKLIIFLKRSLLAFQFVWDINGSLNGIKFKNKFISYCNLDDLSDSSKLI